MSLLAPLYALAAIAIAAPILFHFLQRTPHGEQEFSSLMFLRPSPPQFTRQHRLTNWLLLLLRAAALALLAIAFSRPFLRASSVLDIDVPARSVLLLIDTSASMRRDGIWDETIRRGEQVIADVRPTDRLALVTYDRAVRTLVSFRAWNDADPSQRISLVRDQLRSLQPTWFHTDLAQGLSTAADLLLEERQQENQDQPLQIALLSDLQEGSDLDALQSYEWPEEISLDVHTVGVDSQRTNATLQAIPASPEDLDETQQRVLVTNVAGGEQAGLKLVWSTTTQAGTNESNAATKSHASNSSIDVHVPPGQSRVVRVTQPENSSLLVLQGDDHPFDNHLYLTSSPVVAKRLLVWRSTEGPLTAESSSDAENGDRAKQRLEYYLERAILDTRQQRVSVEALQDPLQIASCSPEEAPMAVIMAPLPETAISLWRAYVRSGGKLLVVLDQQAVSHPELGKTISLISEAANGPSQFVIESAPPVSSLNTEPQPKESEKSKGDSYAMLSQIDFAHPLFRPFADPRFNDFTKIKFWTHHRVTWQPSDPWRVVAQFDDDAPALLERNSDKGTIWVLTCGWQPAESQLALSTKFVPLLLGMFGTGNAADRSASDRLPLVGDPMFVTHDESSDSRDVVTPNGERISPHDGPTVARFEEPGIYRLERGTTSTPLAVNLVPEESRVRPLTLDKLEQFGVRVGKQSSLATLREEQRQMRNAELESRQKLWRWGIFAALCAVVTETWLSRRPSQSIVAIVE